VGFPDVEDCIDANIVDSTDSVNKTREVDVCSAVCSNENELAGVVIVSVAATASVVMSSMVAAGLHTKVKTPNIETI
jgi:hypothetical protein